MHLSGDICKHCNKQCTETGEQGQAIQCDLCGVWVYALCDGLSKDQYQGLVSLTSSIENLAYLCKLNSCQTRFKQMIFKIAKAKNDNNEIQSRIEKVEAKLDKIVQEVGSKLENHSKTIESIPSSASAVEVKLNKWFKSLVPSWILIAKVLKSYHQMLQALLLPLPTSRPPWLQSKEKGISDSVI